MKAARVLHVKISLSSGERTGPLEQVAEHVDRLILFQRVFHRLASRCLGGEESEAK